MCPVQVLYTFGVIMALYISMILPEQLNRGSSCLLNHYVGFGGGWEGWHVLVNVDLHVQFCFFKLKAPKKAFFLTETEPSCIC